MSTLLKTLVAIIVAAVLIIPVGLLLLPLSAVVFAIGLTVELLLSLVLGVISIFGFFWYITRKEKIVGKDINYSLNQSKQVGGKKKS